MARQILRDGLPGAISGWSTNTSTAISHSCASASKATTLSIPGASAAAIWIRRVCARRDLLLAEMERDPNDSRSAFYLARATSTSAITRIQDLVRAAGQEMGGWDEGSTTQTARRRSVARLDEPWPDVQDAYLKAWNTAPSARRRHAIAHRYRANERYQLGYMFASQAAQIPLPGHDRLFVGGDVHNWRAMDEQAVCASWINRRQKPSIFRANYSPAATCPTRTAAASSHPAATFKSRC